MKSLTRRVAEFCRRPNGATSSEVAEHFDIDMQDAKAVMRTIRKAVMYSTTETKEANRIRVRVAEIKGSAHKRVPVIAKNIITGEECNFESISEAEDKGGFCASAIRKCLRGAHYSHGGYYWKRA